MSLNEKLDKYWENVDKGLAKLLDSGILPVVDPESGKEWTAKYLTEQIAKLRSKPYTIAVCGDVNTGKSTLLNSLLFGDSVLPTFPTPMTAKLTFIRHARGNPRFEVEFYDRDEWKELLDSEYQGEKRKKLNDWLVRCQAQGVNMHSWVTSPRHPNHVGCNLDALPEFCSDVISGKGKYTPFVKAVTVYIEHEALKNLQIVDTPGLNDSNIINSEVTTKWIGNAHAVVYLMLPRGPGQADLDFFRMYFPSAEVAARSRLFVLNQIDTPTDYESTQAISRLGEEPEYRDLGLFGPEETICSYSALSVLIQKKTGNHRPLTREEEDAVRKRGLDHFPGDPDDLEKKLSEKLFQSESGGEVRVAKASGLLLQVYDIALRTCAEESGKCKNLLDDCDRSDSELVQQIETHKKWIDALREKQQKGLGDFDNMLDEEFESVRDCLDKAHDYILEEVRKAAKESGGTDDFARAHVPVELHKARREAFKKVKREVRRVKGTIQKRLEEIRDDLNVDAEKKGIWDRIVVNHVSLDIDTRLQDAVDNIEVSGKALYANLPGRFRKFITFTSTAQCVANVVAEVEPCVKTNVEECTEQLHDMFFGAFREEFHRILQAFMSHCEEREKELNVAREDLENAKARREALEQEQAACQARAKELEAARREMKDLLGELA